MFGILKHWRNQRILAQRQFTDAEWRQIANQLPILDRLTEVELTQLFEIATLFLHDKSFSGAHGFVISDRVKQNIALQACLPILNLGLEWYAGWSSIIVYPHSFQSDLTTTDDLGIVHQETHNRSGEAWLHGPVILSWDEVQQSGVRDGHNVVIHEFVHKLDMLNGRANGFPPMQPDINPTEWTDIMTKGFTDFQANPKPGLDRYGATNPAEFFAVLSEVFFETPTVLLDSYPDIFEIMVKFFRQSPLGPV